MIIFNSEGFGVGDPELSRKMMKGFLKMLTKQAKKPNTLFFLGDGVKLLTKGTLVLDILQELSEQGTELLACRAALEWYGLENDLVVGKVSSTGILLQKMEVLDVVTV